MDDKVNGIRKKLLLKSTKTWDGDDYNKLNLKEPEVSVLRIEIGVGESLPVHRHDLINVAYVQKGNLTVITENGQQIIVREGECLPELVGKYHFGKNDGDESIVLIVFYVGEKGTCLSVNR